MIALPRPTVRKEKPSDHDAVDGLLRDAFGGRSEADLVERLRLDPAHLITLVAERGNGVIGVVAFSRVALPSGLVAAALSPLAVDASRRREGVGSALVQVGLAQARRLGAEAALTVGHPKFFARFGFSAATAASVRAPWSGPAFLGRFLKDDAPPMSGDALYADAFFPEEAASS